MKEASVHPASGQKLKASNFSVNLHHPPREQPLIWTQELLLLWEIITNSKNLIITTQIYPHLPTKKVEWIKKNSTMIFLNGRNMDDQFLFCFFQAFLNGHRFLLQLKKKPLYFKNQIFLELKTWKYISSDELFFNTEWVNSYKRLAVMIDDISKSCFVIIIWCKQCVTHHLGRWCNVMGKNLSQVWSI